MSGNRPDWRYETLPADRSLAWSLASIGIVVGIYIIWLADDSLGVQEQLLHRTIGGLLAAPFVVLTLFAVTRVVRRGFRRLAHR